MLKGSLVALLLELTAIRLINTGLFSAQFLKSCMSLFNKAWIPTI